MAADLPLRDAALDLPDVCALRHVSRVQNFVWAGVPLVGWDIAITKDHGMCLLEANLSCNFFRASFDVAAYGAFVEEVLAYLESPPPPSPTPSPGASPAQSPVGSPMGSPSKPRAVGRWKEQ